VGTALLAIVLVLLVLTATLVAALFVPAEFIVSASTGAGLRWRVRWLFGLVRVARPRRCTKPAPARAEAREALRAKREKREERAAKKRRHRRRRPLRMVRTARQLLSIEGLFTRATRMVRDLLGAVVWRRGHVAVRAGAGDPADTGELCGVVFPLLMWLPRSPGLRVEFEPDFGELMFAAEGEAAGRLVPARIVSALGRFAVSRPGRRALKVMVWDRRR